MPTDRGNEDVDDELEVQPRVALKFAEELAPPGEHRPAALAIVLEQSGLTQLFGEVRLLPLFESVTRERLAELVNQARRTDPSYQAANFSAWFQVVCPPGADPDDVASRLRDVEGVEAAYVMRPAPPPVDANDDPRSTNQGYLGPAPNGIDARYAWRFPGGDGAGVGFVDMEAGWNLAHEDLVAAGITLISGVNKDWRSHGTQTLGTVRMVDNALGGIGIAPQCTARVISVWRTSSNWNNADTIVDAADKMAYGDVLLLEAQSYDPEGQDRTVVWPVEIADATFDAIRLTTALGVVVVEPSGNSLRDLDDYATKAGKRIFNRSSPDFRESGAIMVSGASSKTPHTQLAVNWGNRVDCYAWGQHIETTTTNEAGTDNTSYTSASSGSSGASAIVAGAAVIVQALAETSLGYRFSPGELREVLTTDGTPSANPPTDKIGVMPDLRAIISDDRLHLAPDLYLRDHVGDNGDQTSGHVSASPDIILRQAAVADPQDAFGPASGTENEPALSDQARTSHDNFVYVRVLNRGGTPADDTSVDVYWSRPATLVTPDAWQLIGTTTLASVPTGNILTVSDALIWPSGSVPEPGHYCFIAVAGNADDPMPPATFGTFDQFLAYVRNNNNVAWRNIDVVEGKPAPSGGPGGGAPAGFHRRTFLVRGAFDTGHQFQLEAIGALPGGSRALLEAPTWFADALRGAPCPVQRHEAEGVVRIPLNPHGAQRLGAVVLHRGSEAKCHVLVSLPSDHRTGAHELAVRQMYEGEEVGRVTWRFGATRRVPKKPLRRRAGRSGE